MHDIDNGYNEEYREIPDWITYVSFCIFFVIMFWMAVTIIYWTIESQSVEGVTLYGIVHNQCETFLSIFKNLPNFFKNLHIK
jgi:hypothetical protein